MDPQRSYMGAPNRDASIINHNIKPTKLLGTSRHRSLHIFCFGEICADEDVSPTVSLSERFMGWSAGCDVVVKGLSFARSRRSVQIDAPPGHIREQLHDLDLRKILL